MARLAPAAGRKLAVKALALRDVRFSYGGRCVLEAVSLELAPGRVTVLVGPSGTGKTTLLWLAAGLLRPEAGTVGLAEDADGPEAKAGPVEPIDPRRTALGMVFQHLALWDHLSVQEHLELVLAGRVRGRGQRRRRAETVMQQMRLTPLRRRRPGELSGGQRQRLAIARALAAEPAWLLLDEPLAHLDGPARNEVFELLRGALAGARCGVLMATHNAEEAMRLADRIVVLLEGRVAQEGPPLEVYRRPASLAAALALGPACELAGTAERGRLLCGGRVVLEGLPREAAGPHRLILRPADVEFVADPAGPAKVVAAEFTGREHVLTVEVAGAAAPACWGAPVPPAAGTPGRLRMTPRP